MIAALVPLPKARVLTGHSPDTLIRLNRNDAPGIVVTRGTGTGRRYYLNVSNWNRYVQSLPAAG